MQLSSTTANSCADSAVSVEAVKAAFVKLTKFCKCVKAKGKVKHFRCLALGDVSPELEEVME